ncbi:helix-turn-helix domain-containing protein [Aquimarina sediminis]|uniref:helix-turn-helix domain-containing protein n=1 Tax=Aquimarina sediminis TaxID=2070536 RepID=UPI000CA031CC|nr:helix-turn-helix domain-containing protein [Aquimarina sediminis]
MELIIFEKESYYKMMEEMMTLMYKVIRQAKEDALDAKGESADFIGTKDAMKLLGVKSRNRLYDLRDAKQIEYYQHGRRILYSKRSIITYLKSQKIT